MANDWGVKHVCGEWVWGVPHGVGVETIDLRLVTGTGPVSDPIGYLFDGAEG